MTGPLGVMAVILLETAVGGVAVLWASGVWGVVRRGFFLLSGITLALMAAGAWALTAAEAPDTPAASALALLVALLVLWQLLLFVRLSTAAHVTGLAAAAVGLVALVLFAQLRNEAEWLGVLELALGSLFLGSTVFGLLLGHWYLVERRLTNAYMVRSAAWYAGGVAGAIIAVALSARDAPPDVGTTFSPLLAVPGFTVLLGGGLVGICAIIAGFVWRLAREGGRSIQAATGYFYLAVIMAFAAELAIKLNFFI